MFLVYPQACRARLHPHFPKALMSNHAVHASTISRQVVNANVTSKLSVSIKGLLVMVLAKYSLGNEALDIP